MPEKKSKHHLKLVPYKADDYSLGETLAGSEDKDSKDRTFISAAFSLFFQWPEHSCCSIFMTSDEVFPCSMDYDRDEREPSEIYLTGLANEQLSRLSTFESVKLRFEVFDTCYEFETDILYIESEDEASNQDRRIILKAPTQLIRYRRRNLPRHRIPESKRANFNLELLGSESTKLKFLMTEISLSSFKISSNKTDFDKISRFKLRGKLTFDAEFIRNEGSEAIFQTKFESDIEYGTFFDVYREIAFPDIRWRYDFPINKVLDVYKKSGFFEKFGTEELKQITESIPSTWASIKSATHKSTADYVTVNDQGDLIGASSTAIAFYENELPVWCFQHTCAIKGVEYLKHTEALYKWRAEYLGGKRRSLKVYAFFDSRSRWIDRIYVKFSNFTDEKTLLAHCYYKKITFKRTDSDGEVKFKRTEFGDSNRWYYSSNIALSGTCPRYLNAVDNLEQILITSKKATPKDINSIANSILKIRSESSGKISLVSTTKSYDYEDAQDTVFDRLCLFPDDCLVFFLKSVEYAVAVTMRKLHEYES